MIGKTKNILKEEGYLDNEDAEIILYGIEQLKTMLGGILFVLAISVMLGILHQGLLFLILFIPLRMYSGGYHASSQFKCTIISSIIIICGLIYIRYFALNTPLNNIIQLFNYFVVLILSPVENDIRKLSSNEKTEFKKKSFVIASLIFIVYLIAFFKEKIWVIATIQVSNTIVSFSLVVGYLKYNLLLKSKK